MKTAIQDRIPESPTVLGRPLVGRIALIPWTIMVIVIYAGIRYYQDFFDFSFSPFSIDYGSQGGANVRTYQYSTELAFKGEPFYEIAPSGLGDWAVYLYPPITTIAFAPLRAIDWETGWAIVVLLNLVAGVAAAYLVVRFIEGKGWELGWLDAGLIAGMFLACPFTVGTIYYGNINLILALTFIVGFLTLERNHQLRSGVVFGFAALFKVFPALVGVWFLYKRAWRAVAAAVTVGVTGLVAGLLVFGWDRTETFFRSVVWDRSETAAFVGGYSPHDTYYITVQRPLSQILWTIWPGAPMDLLFPLALLVSAGVIAYFYRGIETQMEWIMAIFATVVTIVTLFPALQWYMVLLFFPMIPLLYLWDGNGRLPFALAALILFFNDSPGTLVDWVNETSMPRVVELLLIDVFTLASVQLYAIAGMIAACAWYRYWGPEPSIVARRGRQLRERVLKTFQGRRQQPISPQRGDD